MSSISTNAASILILLVSTFGFNISESLIVDAVTGVFALVSIIGLIRNQWNRKDIDMFFFRKK